ncbi:MAG: iron-sulfur cluster assembly scaffold protein [Patescibacteria group bacterium]
MDSLYRDHILAHYRHPQNYGLRDDFDIEARGDNPSCGDSIAIRLKMDGGIISGVSFENKGCVISRAAASLGSSYIIGRDIAEIRRMARENIAALLGVTLMPMRYQCAALFLEAVKKAV